MVNFYRESDRRQGFLLLVDMSDWVQDIDMVSTVCLTCWLCWTCLP